MYEDVYRLCQNVEKMMGMFSEELRILDRNTVQYMMDEMHAEIDRQKAENDSQRIQLADKDVQLANKDMQLADKDMQLADKNAEIEHLKQLISEMQK